MARRTFSEAPPPKPPREIGMPPAGRLYWLPGENPSLAAVSLPPDPDDGYIGTCTHKVTPDYPACSCGLVRMPPARYPVRLLVLAPAWPLVDGAWVDGCPIVLRFDGAAEALALFRPGQHHELPRVTWEEWDTDALGLEGPPAPGAWWFVGELVTAWNDEGDHVGDEDLDLLTEWEGEYVRTALPEPPPHPLGEVPPQPERPTRVRRGR